MEFKDYNDEELVYMIREDSLEAKDILFTKYNYIIDIIIKKYAKVIKILNIDFKEIHQDAYVGFTDAVNNYDSNKDASLKSFISLCVERKISTALKKASTLKSRFASEALSLEQNLSDEEEKNLLALLKDDTYNPLRQIIDTENFNELNEKIKTELSDSEYQVYSLLISGLTYIEIAELLDKEPKQIDNSIQRIRNKVKRIIEK